MGQLTTSIMLSGGNNYVDRSGWRPGPWMFERRDEYQWTDQKTGFRCCIRRHPRYGTLNGYVGLPPGHFGYGQDPNEAGNKFWWDYSVHWGLNFGGYVNNPEHPEPQRMWPGSKFPEENNLWWVGFDCNHSGDAVPSSVDHIVGCNDYKDIGFVRRQIEGLLEQLEEKEREMEEEEKKTPEAKIVLTAKVVVDGVVILEQDVLTIAKPEEECQQV